MHETACDTLPQGNKQQYRPTTASNAKLPDSFGLDRPATAKELMSGPESIQLSGQARQHPQQELPSLGSSRACPAHNSQLAACLPRALPSALGVFADCSSSKEDDTELLQAAMEADRQLQHRVTDRGQEGLPADLGDIDLGTNQPGGMFNGQRKPGHPVPDWADGPQLDLIGYEAHAAQDHMQRSIPGIVYECSNEDADCQAPEQLRGVREIGDSQGIPSMHACSRPGQAARRDHDEKEASLSDVLLTERPAPEDAPDDFPFCDGQDTAWFDQPASLQGQTDRACSEPLQRPSARCPPRSDAQPALTVDCSGEDRCVITADQTGWHNNAQRGNAEQVSPLAAAKSIIERPRTPSNPSSRSGSAVRARAPGFELEDIHMVTDGSEDEDMQQDLSRPTAATAFKARDASASADSQGLHVEAHGAAEPAQDQAHEQAFQSEWALEDEDSEGIIFDDTTVDFTAQWMQSVIEPQAVMHADNLMTLEQQPVHSSLAEAHARQKRAREELRDKLIQVGVPLPQLQ